MAIKPIVLLPDPILYATSKAVERFDDPLRRFAADMLETMYEAPGIGLAAIQVGVPLRIITMDLSKTEGEKQPRVFINPEILSASQDTVPYEEGCLSVPEYYEEVQRPARVRLRYTDLDGKVREEDAEGLFATCIQHEIDHLEGVLFIDHLSRLKRERAIKKFTKAARRAAE